MEEESTPEERQPLLAPTQQAAPQVQVEVPPPVAAEAEPEKVIVNGQPHVLLRKEKLIDIPAGAREVPCKVCQTPIPYTPADDTFAIKCHVCLYETPVKKFPDSRCFVRCKCNFLFKCITLEFPRKCYRCDTLVAFKLELEPDDRFYKCAYCHKRIFAKVNIKYKKCCYCDGRSSLGVNHARYCIRSFAFLGCALFAGVFVLMGLTPSVGSHHPLIYFAYPAFILGGLACLGIALMLKTVGTSLEERPEDRRNQPAQDRIAEGPDRTDGNESREPTEGERRRRDDGAQEGERATGTNAERRRDGQDELLQARMPPRDGGRTATAGTSRLQSRRISQQEAHRVAKAMLLLAGERSFAANSRQRFRAPRQAAPGGTTPEPRRDGRQDGEGRVPSNDDHGGSVSRLVENESRSRSRSRSRSPSPVGPKGLTIN